MLLKNIGKCWNTNITFYEETSGALNSNLYLNAAQITIGQTCEFKISQHL
jgi:hypothetical protein